MANNKSLYSLFGTDQKKETEGVWCDFGPSKIKIARAGSHNKEYAKCLARKMQPHARKMQAGALPGDQMIEILTEVYAETVITDWEGVTDEKGKVLSFNKKNIIKVLTDLPDLYDAITQIATSREMFGDDDTEEMEKNS